MFKYLKVTVPYYIPIAVLGMLVGAVFTSKNIFDIRLVLAAVSLAALVGGFNTLNGVFDMFIDKINKPRRPIANGSISARAGIAYSVMLYVISLVFAFLINWNFTAIVVISILLTSFYSLPGIRLRSKFIVNTLTGLIFYGILCPLAGWSIYPALPIPWAMIIFIFLLGSGIAITKDFEDIYGDRVYNIKTLPDTLGIEKTRRLIMLLISSSFAYVAAAALLGLVDIRYLGILVFVPWGMHTIFSLNPRGNGNDNLFFIKNIMLAISVELLIIAIVLI